jgi:hypothetical protein
MSFSLTGQNRDNLNIDTRIICKDKKKAQVLSIWIQPMVMSYISVISQGDTQFNDALLDALKFSNEGNDIIIKADIGPALQEQLKKSALNASSGAFQPQIAKRKKNVKPNKADTDSGIGLPPPPATR